MQWCYKKKTKVWLIYAKLNNQTVIQKVVKKRCGVLDYQLNNGLKAKLQHHDQPFFKRIQNKEIWSLEGCSKAICYIDHWSKQVCMCEREKIDKW